MPLAANLHPSLDPRLLARHQSYSQNPANDQTFLFKVLDEMENDTSLREFVHSSFIEGDLSWLFHDGQKKMYEVITKANGEVLILCSRQLGKSFFILLFAIMHCAKRWKGRKPLVRIMCQTQKQVNEIVQDNMSLIQPLAPEGWIVRTKSEARWKVGLGEIRVGMIAAAHVDSKRGGNATLIITEEGAFSPSDAFKDAVQFVLGPQLLRSEGLLVHVTTPSKDEGHYIHTVVLPKCEASGNLVRLTIYHNPQLTDEQIIKAYELIDDGTDEGWSREYLVEIVRSYTLTVIPEFDESRHVKKLTPPDFANWLSSIDFGGSLDPHAILLCYYDFERNKFCIYRSKLLPINSELEDLVAVASEKEKEKTQGPYFRVFDHNSDLLSILLAKLGFAHIKPSKGPGSFDAHVQALRIAFKQDMIEIDESCKDVISHFKYGRLNAKRDDFERANGHHCDFIAAAMYGFNLKQTHNPFPHGYGANFRTHHINPPPPHPLLKLFE